MSAAVSQEANALHACNVRRNSFGSKYWAFFADPELVAGIAASEIQRSFRRVVLDPARGLVLLMAPARAHERASELSTDVIKGFAALLETPIISLRSMRWRKPTDPPNTGPEADCCFYVGERATRYLEAEASGEDTADRFVLDNPPDIVVEIGVTNVDRDKLRIYHDRGVSECWQADRDKDNLAPTVQFFRIPEEGEPEILRVSEKLPKTTPAMFATALHATAQMPDARDALAAIRSVMLAHGAITPPPPNDGGTKGGGGTLKPV